MPWLRRAGHARLSDGRALLWSVAEGNRGRRWRASTRDPSGALRDDLLLEVAPDGRITRLEATAPAGQLTFHPEADQRSAHGNVVTRHGIRHIALAWTPGQRIEVPWSPIADAVLFHDVAGGVPPGPEHALDVATIGPDLVPHRRTISIAVTGPGIGRIDGRAVAVDGHGVPRLGETAVDTAEWALEDPSLAPS